MRALLAATVALLGGGADPAGPEGAARLSTTTAIQQSAERIWPDLPLADRDRSKVYWDGCLVPFRIKRSPTCAYGWQRSRKTVVLFGDSHASQYFPALEAIALQRGWRLVVLAKAGCPPGADPGARPGFNRVCRIWRSNSLYRIRRSTEVAMVVTSGAGHYHPGGLDRTNSDNLLAASIAGTLRRLTRYAPRVVFVRDPPRPPFDVPPCVAAAMTALEQCAFPRTAGLHTAPSIAEAAAAVPGVTVIDPIGVLCPADLCPAVIGDALVWRYNAHITATYAATMAPWLAAQLPPLVPS